MDSLVEDAIRAQAVISLSQERNDTHGEGMYHTLYKVVYSQTCDIRPSQGISNIWS